jgi:uncharacterized membrane-anchored protein YitT (DUF2179 family)
MENEEKTKPLPPKITRENFGGDNKKTKRSYIIKMIIVLLFSTFLVAFASYSLIAPNKFTIGGVAGTAILINAATKGKVEQSIILFCINLPLVISSFFFVRKKFAVLTTASILLQSAWLVVFERAFPNLLIVFEQPVERVFAAVLAGGCIGSAVALMFNIGGSTGGGDIIAVMIQKKMKSSSIAWIIFGINCVVIGSSFFVYYDSGLSLAYNLLPIIISIAESFVESKIHDSMVHGWHSAVEFRILTDKPEEMSNALMVGLSRGVTMIPATGMYTKEPHPMVMCVINKRQVPLLKQIVKEVDPDSFALMSHVSQVFGLGFYRYEDTNG